ncbi:protein RETICULATA-RELATED 4, chloroplastic-like [Herrania umbratica]|uniref:Protein RETICULATA-RELATED 4, chloroplastic-like n=1 Tax=Herrania umbratica TaxID=108875 RepID=A0A6J0ZYD8_9ROSI|nr:protein RETICULATA-RELATED 4, chloroplastic-like [Herrania umbratica]
MKQSDHFLILFLCLYDLCKARHRANIKGNKKEGNLLPQAHSVPFFAMAVATFSNFSTPSFFLQSPSCSHQRQQSFAITTSNSRSSLFTPSLALTVSIARNKFHPTIVFSKGNGGWFSGGTGGGGSGSGGGGGGGGGGRGHGDHGNQDRSRNRSDAILALAEVGRTFQSLPKDIAAAIKAGKVPGSIVSRYLELEKSPIFRWLLNFGGFRERLLADDLFLTKVAIECGVGIFTKSAAELERRRERIMKELDFVFADVVMALIADFMLVWLPAPTVSLRPPLALSSGPISTFFYNCPDNAFQVALAGTSYSFLQRVGAIVRNGAKLFAVGTGASLVGVGVTNLLIKARKVFDKSFAGESEDVPILSTSVAYGVYMAVSSNLRYQVLAGVIEQRILEPLLHQHKIILSAICFAVRTGNTFLGSLIWVDCARWVGVQKTRE